MIWVIIGISVVVVLLIVFLGILCYNLFFKDSGSSSFDVSSVVEEAYENC